MRWSLSLVTIGLLALGCGRPPCEETCRKVAACKLQKQQGERMLGEGSQPADVTCMKRCASDSAEFASCEGKSRECGPILECIPY